MRAQIVQYESSGQMLSDGRKRETSYRLHKDFPVAVTLQQNCLGEDAFHREVGKHVYGTETSSLLGSKLGGTPMSASALLLNVAGHQPAQQRSKGEMSLSCEVLVCV